MERILFLKQNQPTSIPKALENRIYDVLHGYPMESARTAIEAVLAEIDRQAPPETPEVESEVESELRGLEPEVIRLLAEVSSV